MLLDSVLMYSQQPVTLISLPRNCEQNYSVFNTYKYIHVILFVFQFCLATLKSEPSVSSICLCLAGRSGHVCLLFNYVTGPSYFHECKSVIHYHDLIVEKFPWSSSHAVSAVATSAE
jgi:hypothetical protein